MRGNPVDYIAMGAGEDECVLPPHHMILAGEIRNYAIVLDEKVKILSSISCQLALVAPEQNTNSDFRKTRF